MTTTKGTGWAPAVNALTDALAAAPAAGIVGLAFKVFVLAHELRSNDGWPAGTDQMQLPPPDDGRLRDGVFAWSLVRDAARLLPALAPLVVDAAG